MNKTLTSREAILLTGKEIVVQSGLQALNIRDIARKCGISVGSVYNYFPSKSDLVVATVESVWTEIMHDSKGYSPQHDLAGKVQALFYTIQNGCRKYSSFFSIHSMSLANIHKDKGREVMNQYFRQIKHGLLQTLDQDPKVKKDAFSEKFSKTDFVDFIFSNMLTLLMQDIRSCDFLTELIKRTIYD